MLSDVIKRYGGEKIDPLDVYKDIFRIGEGFIQKEFEDSGSFKANPIAYYKNENEDHGHFRIMFDKLVFTKCISKCNIRKCLISLYIQ